jgi:hypothetical protein
VALPLGIAIVFLLIIFGYFYNRLFDFLKGKEHTSLYVAGGVLVTIFAGALISWKSALLFMFLFALDGIFMIVGEFKRTEREHKSAPRRKRFPYAANGLLDEAKMASMEARNVMGKAIKKGGATNEDLLVIEHELNTVTLKILEVQQIQINQK